MTDSNVYPSFSKQVVSKKSFPCDEPQAIQRGGRIRRWGGEGSGGRGKGERRGELKGEERTSLHGEKK